MNGDDPELSRAQIFTRYSHQQVETTEFLRRRAPFKFLDSYGIDDADIFFGRDHEIEELLHHFHSNGCALVYGEHGCGKSSLVQCGLRSRIPAEDALFLAPRVHGSGLPTLCAQLFEETARALGLEAIEPPEENLIETLRGICDAASRPVVLFLDQFEELFLFHNREARHAFATDLAAIDRSRLNVKLIIGVRQDYLGHLTELEATVEGLFDNRFWLRRMSRETAARAVLNACQAGAVKIEDSVATAVLRRLDPKGEGVELPYLQVTMDRLYREAMRSGSRGTEITAQAVNQLGDLTNILGEFLADEVSKLPKPETGRQILKSFVTQEGTRKSIPRADIDQEVAGFGAHIDPEVLQDHLDRLATVRILREIAETGSFELRHDALAARVADWITEFERELLEVRDNVQNRYREYDARGKPDSALLDWGFLKYLEAYLTRLDPLLDRELSDYIRASRRQQRQAGRRRKRMTIWSSVAGVVIIVVSGLIYIAKVTKARDAATAAHTDAELRTVEATSLAEEAQMSRLKSDKARADARALSDFLIRDILRQTTSGEMSDPNTTLRSALENALTRMGDRFETRPLVEASIRHAIGETFRMMSLEELAVPELLKSVNLRERRLGPADEQTLESRTALANAMVNAGLPDEALPLARETTKRINEAELADSQLGIDALFAEARASLRMESPQTALPHFAKCAAWSRKTHGDDDDRTWKHQDAHAQCLRLTDHNDEAIKILENVLSRWRRKAGGKPTHPRNTLFILAKCYEVADRNEDAARLYLENLELEKATYGPSHRNTRISQLSLAELYVTMKRPNDASILRREIAGHDLELSAALTLIGDLESAGRTNTPTYFDTLQESGWHYLQYSLHAEAEAKLQQVVRHGQAAGKDYLGRYRAMAMLGQVYLLQGSTKQAEPQLTAAEKGLWPHAAKLDFGEQSDLIFALQSLADINENRGDSKEAARLREKLTALTKSTQDE